MKTPRPKTTKQIERELIEVCKDKKLTRVSFSSCPITHVYNKVVGEDTNDTMPRIETVANHWNRSVTDIWAFIWGFDGVEFETAGVGSAESRITSLNRPMYSLGQRIAKRFLKS